MLCTRSSRRRRAARKSALPDLTTRRPAPKGAADFRVPPSEAGPKRVFLCCHYCSYDPPTVPDNGTCPKCGGHSWERFTVSTKLLPKGTN